jgi:hypothetical protein
MQCIRFEAFSAFSVAKLSTAPKNVVKLNDKINDCIDACVEASRIDCLPYLKLAAFEHFIMPVSLRH